MDTNAREHELSALPDVPELMNRLGQPDPVFDAWRNRQDDRSWVRLDLSALRIGYELGLRVANAGRATLREHAAADAPGPDHPAHWTPPPAEPAPPEDAGER